MSDHELDISEFIEFAASTATHRELRDAIDLASDQDTTTWLTDNGKRIAAIVPVDAAEYAGYVLDGLDPTEQECPQHPGKFGDH